MNKKILFLLFYNINSVLESSRFSFSFLSLCILFLWEVITGSEEQSNLLIRSVLVNTLELFRVKFTLKYLKFLLLLSWASFQSIPIGSLQPLQPDGCVSEVCKQLVALDTNYNSIIQIKALASVLNISDLLLFYKILVRIYTTLCDA